MEERFRGSPKKKKKIGREELERESKCWRICYGKVWNNGGK
jgi:hypothetical protein